MRNSGRLPIDSAAPALGEQLAEETRRKYLANVAMLSEAKRRGEQIDSDSGSEEPAAGDPEFEKFMERMERELLDAADTEAAFYGVAPDPIVEIFRDDLLRNRHDGTPRPELEREALKEAWKTARDYLLPRMTYSEPTAKDQVRDTDWIEIFGGKGKHKTTLGVYLVHWYVEDLAWISAIYSTIPIYAYSLDYPFVLRGDDGRRILHPKYRPVTTLREIGEYENCLLFLDELANLLPGRNFSDRTQWLVTTWTRNFRKRNVMLIATTQRETSPDPELRENFNLLLAPDVVDSPDGRRLVWRQWLNYDSDYSEYRAWKSGYGKCLVYPKDDVDGGFPDPAIPWLYAAFDSRLEVPILFQEPLERSKAEFEAEALMTWIEETDSGGVNSNYYSVGELPADGELKKALDAWNVTEKKMYDSDELLLISQDFKRLYHRLPEPGSEPDGERVELRSFECECGASYPDPHKLASHVSGVRNAIRGLTNRPLPKERVEEYRRRHPSQVKEIDLQARTAHGEGAF